VSAIVLQGDARSLPLPDGCVDLVVTSPPYFGLRSYTDGGQHYAGQIGSEETPREYVANLLDCTREWVRVLKPGGSIFVNLGDKYSTVGGGPPGQSSGIGVQRGGRNQHIVGTKQAFVTSAPPKCLLGLPWRYALGCIDDLGLILRAEIIWSKPNGLPESVQDRVRRAHEQVFHFTRQPRYYAAVDEIREPHAETSLARFKSGFGQTTYSAATDKRYRADELAANPLGKLPGSVWDIPSQPLTVPAALGVDHFAAFPCELPRRIILGWSPPGICIECGEGRRPVADVATIEDRKGRKQRIVDLAMDGAHGPDGRGGERWRQTVRISGYACACGTDSIAPVRPAVVLDPFGGTGTTALVADAFGRTAITVDRSADYCRLARWRTTDPGERAKAMQVPKPPPVADGQGSLFGLDGAA
jgi:DNA modification methylase